MILACGHHMSQSTFDKLGKFELDYIAKVGKQKIAKSRGTADSYRQIAKVIYDELRWPRGNLEMDTRHKIKDALIELVPIVTKPSTYSNENYRIWQDQPGFKESDVYDY